MNNPHPIDEAFRAKLSNFKCLPSAKIEEAIFNHINETQMIINNLTLYVVQEARDGEPGEPILFQKHAAADRHYLKLITDEFSAEIKKEGTKKNPVSLNSFAEAERWYKDHRKKYAYYRIRYWIIEAQQS